MSVPYRHVADYTDLTPDEVSEVANITRTAMRVLRAVAGPHGFNIGSEPRPRWPVPGSPGTCISTWVPQVGRRYELRPDGGPYPRYYRSYCPRRGSCSPTDGPPPSARRYARWAETGYSALLSRSVPTSGRPGFICVLRKAASPWRRLWCFDGSVAAVGQPAAAATGESAVSSAQPRAASRGQRPPAPIPPDRLP